MDLLRQNKVIERLRTFNGGAYTGDTYLYGTAKFRLRKESRKAKHWIIDKEKPPVKS